MVELGQCATALDSRTDANTTHAGAPRHASARTTAIPRTERQAILLRTVKLDVIPRLRSVAACGATAPVEAPAAPRAPAPVLMITDAHVAELANLTLHGHDGAVEAFVGNLREQGVAAEALVLDLLTPVALQLGEWWEQDVCSFLDVTAGMWRLQDALHGLGSSFQAAEPSKPGPRILLVPLPGEQHTFGLSMVHEFFRRAGWDAWTGPVGSRAELTATLRRQWVDVVGFSLGSDERLEAARAEIQAVRLASRNPGLAVMVGGPPFVGNPNLAASIGAEDGVQAVAAAAALVSARMQADRQTG